MVQDIEKQLRRCAPSKCPGARKFFSIDDFVKHYNINMLASRLDTEFSCRDSELIHLLNALEENNLIILSGKLGVGKSRLAIEGGIKYFEKNSTVKCYGIFHRGNWCPYCNAEIVAYQEILSSIHVKGA